MFRNAPECLQIWVRETEKSNVSRMCQKTKCFLVSKIVCYGRNDISFLEDGDVHDSI